MTSPHGFEMAADFPPHEPVAPRDDLSGFEAGHDRALTGPELMAENKKLREEVKRLRYSTLMGVPDVSLIDGDTDEDLPGYDGYRVLDFGGNVVAHLVTPDSMQVGDRYHTIPELYEHRRRLTAVLATIGAINGDSWRSKQHHPTDGPMFDGSFIVGIDLPGGTITYHYPLDSWDEFAAVPVLEHAPKWDGAGPPETLVRLAEFADHLKQAIDDGRVVQEQAREAADAAVEAAGGSTLNRDEQD